MVEKTEDRISSAGEIKWQESRLKQKGETQDRECKVSGTKQGALWCISGAEKFVSVEDRGRHYGNGLLAASLADGKQDLGKAYSLW